ncbi:hypothetical protein [Methylomagnum ishizawai]|uniref:hypothetical protein n=1 Tax=Methylomagnum ishizawai TaxID=1760988 RepID=UPI000F74B940|nr:hypothetical protein [Methylomagnum ishizawai]
MDKESLLEILEKHKNGEITIEQAGEEVSKLGQEIQSERKRGRPRKNKPLEKKKGKKGRPKSEDRENNYKIILTFWVLFGDGFIVSKMNLRGILADVLGVDDSYISKVIARIKKLSKEGCFIGRNHERNMIVCLSPEEFKKANFAKWLGISPSRLVKMHAWRFEVE